MTLNGVVVDDIVECDVRGDQFYGIVTDKEKGQITVMPIGVRSKFPRLVKANQVKARYKKCRT